MSSGFIDDADCFRLDIDQPSRVRYAFTFNPLEDDRNFFNFTLHDSQFNQIGEKLARVHVPGKDLQAPPGTGWTSPPANTTSMCTRAAATACSSTRSPSLLDTNSNL